MSKGPRVQIKSDGSPKGTQVFVDGEPLNNVLEVSWSIKVDEFSTAIIKLDDVPVELLTDHPLINGIH